MQSPYIPAICSYIFIPVSEYAGINLNTFPLNTVVSISFLCLWIMQFNLGSVDVNQVVYYTYNSRKLTFFQLCEVILGSLFCKILFQTRGCMLY